MLVDLEALRPKNETYEHFVLKQVGRAWLFKKGVRFIGCEVHIQGQDISPFGEKKIADVVGIERKKVKQPAMIKMHTKVYEDAITLGKPLGLTTEGWGGKHSWISTYKLKGDEKVSVEASIEFCYQQACVGLSLPKDAYKRLRNPYKQQFTINSVEAKASLSDFRNGFCVSAELSYIIAPKGIIPLEEVPLKVGLIEFDFDKFHEKKDWEVATKVVKRPKKSYDTGFLIDPENPKSVHEEYHEQYCQELIYSIAQESTEESVFWNPFLRHVPDGNASQVSSRYKFVVGQVTPLGIVIERRIGEKTKADKEAEKGQHCSIRSHTEFYKLVVPNEGVTKWISSRIIEEATGYKEKPNPLYFPRTKKI